MQVANAPKPQFWKFPAPHSFQASAIAPRNGKQQFIIFAIGYCLLHGAAARNRQRAFINREREPACTCQPRQIGAQSVAQIHHRVHLEICGQPARFFNPGDEIQMPPANRATQFSGYKKVVVGFSTAAQDAAVGLDRPYDTHDDYGWAICVTGFTTNDGNVEIPRRLIKTAIQIANPHNLFFTGDDEGDKSELRDPRHRGEITQPSHHRFPADRTGIASRDKKQSGNNEPDAAPEIAAHHTIKEESENELFCDRRHHCRQQNDDYPLVHRLRSAEQLDDPLPTRTGSEHAGGQPIGKDDKRISKNQENQAGDKSPGKTELGQSGQFRDVEPPQFQKRHHKENNANRNNGIEDEVGRAQANNLDGTCTKTAETKDADKKSRQRYFSDPEVGLGCQHLTIATVNLAQKRNVNVNARDKEQRIRKRTECAENIVAAHV